MIKDFRDNITEDQVIASILAMADSRGGKYADVLVVPLKNKDGSDTGRAKKFTIAVVGEVVELPKPEPERIIKV